MKAYPIFAIVFLSLVSPLFAQSDSTVLRKIVFGSDYNYPPYEFLDSKGKPTGFNVDLIHAIGEQIGYETEVRLDLWAKVRESFENPKGEINVLDMIYSAARAKQIRFLPHHDVISYVIVWEENAPPVKSLRELQDSILVVTNRAIQQEYVQRMDSTIKLVTSLTNEHALQMVAYGKYNYTLVNQYIAHKFIEANPAANLKTSEKIIFFERLSFVVKKDDIELEKALKEGLVQIKKNGIYSKLYVKWFGKEKKSYQELIKYFLWASGIGICVTLIVAFWIHILHKQVASKTQKIRAIAQEQAKMKQLIQRKNDELEKRNYELDKIIYSVSHNVRAPIATSVGVVNLLDIENAEDKKIRFYSDSIRASLSRLDYYVNKILTYAANKNAEVTVNEVDFQTLVTNAINDVKLIEGADEVLITKHIIQEETFYSEPERIATVLECLMNNAIQFRRGEENYPPFLHIEVKVDTEFAHIKMLDNGLGIEEENLEKIFEMFYRGSIRSKNTGLGLYVVQQIIQKLKGTISLESTYRKGTSVHIKLQNLKL